MLPFVQADGYDDVKPRLLCIASLNPNERIRMKFKSPVYTQVSGSIGGLTYAHNQGGMYTRGRSIPVNPNTFRQTNVRATVSQLSQAWSGALTDVQREQWTVYAAGTPVTNKLGDSIILSGQQMYIRCNTARMQVTRRTQAFATPIVLPRVDDAPAFPGNAIAVDGFNVNDLTAGEFLITATLGGATAAAGDAFLYAGHPVNSGRAFFKGPYQLASALPVAAMATAANFDITDVTDSELWWADTVPAVGMFLPLRIQIVLDDGRVGPSYESIEVIQTA